MNPARTRLIRMAREVLRTGDVTRDRARRYGGVDDPQAELQRTVRALDAMTEISQALAWQTDIDAILRLVAEHGRALVSARAVVIEVEKDGEMVVAAGAGELPQSLIGARLPVQDTVLSRATGTHRTQRLSEQQNRARFQEHGIGRLGLEGSDGLVVPMTYQGESFGALVALDHLGSTRSFGAQHQRLLESFAASAALAVATAQSAARERRRQVMAAAEAERGRWARELHDETLQAMGSVKLMLAAARRAEELEAMRSGVGVAIEQLQRDMDTLRTMVADLRPGALDQLGIEAAVVDLAERIAARGLEIDVDVQLAYEQQRAATRLAPDLETAVYRIIQEALNNAAKHSGATRAVVEVVESGGQVLLKVRDNGSGFDRSRISAGFGLLGMQERVALIGGTLRIVSEPRRGTTVEASFQARRADGGAPASAGPSA